MRDLGETDVGVGCGVTTSCEVNFSGHVYNTGMVGRSKKVFPHLN